MLQDPRPRLIRRHIRRITRKRNVFVPFIVRVRVRTKDLGRAEREKTPMRLCAVPNVVGCVCVVPPDCVAALDVFTDYRRKGNERVGNVVM